MARSSFNRRYYELDLSQRDRPTRSSSGDSVRFANAGEGDIAVQVNDDVTVYLTAAQIADLIHELGQPEGAPTSTRIEWEDEDYE